MGLVVAAAQVAEVVRGAKGAQAGPARKAMDLKGQLDPLETLGPVANPGNQVQPVNQPRLPTASAACLLRHCSQLMLVCWLRPFPWPRHRPHLHCPGHQIVSYAVREAAAIPIGVIEPGTTVVVDKIVVKNSGGLPLPEGGGVKSEQPFRASSEATKSCR